MSNSSAVATRPARSGGFASRKLAPYLFLAPFVLLFIAFIVAPLVYALYMSLFRDTLVGGRQFAGAASYIKVTGDAKFWGGVWNLVLFGIVQVPIMLGLALLFAIVLDRGQVYAKGVFRLGFFLPYAVPSVIAPEAPEVTSAPGTPIRWARYSPLRSSNSVITTNSCDASSIAARVAGVMSDPPRNVTEPIALITGRRPSRA